MKVATTLEKNLTPPTIVGNFSWQFHWYFIYEVEFNISCKLNKIQIQFIENYLK